MSEVKSCCNLIGYPNLWSMLSLLRAASGHELRRVWQQWHSCYLYASAHDKYPINTHLM